MKRNERLNTTVILMSSNGGGLDAHGGSWEVTPPASPNREVWDVEGDLSWPALATQIDE
jgi:hypothetical protein